MGVRVPHLERIVYGIESLGDARADAHADHALAAKARAGVAGTIEDLAKAVGITSRPIGIRCEPGRSQLSCCGGWHVVRGSHSMYPQVHARWCRPEATRKYLGRWACSCNWKNSCLASSTMWVRVPSGPPARSDRGRLNPVTGTRRSQTPWEAREDASSVRRGSLTRTVASQGPACGIQVSDSRIWGDASSWSNNASALDGCRGVTTPPIGACAVAPLAQLVEQAPDKRKT